MIKTNAVIIILVWTFLVIGSTGIKMECEIDADCLPGLSCKMICKDTCRTKCVNLDLLKDTSFVSSEEPFSFDANPFAVEKRVQRDDVANSTPLTISEAELEQEFEEGFETTLPPSSELSTQPVPPGGPTAVPFVGNDVTFPDPAVASSFSPLPEGVDSTTVRPPSQSPQPPGFTTLDELHQSGYDKQDQVKGQTDPQTTVESTLTVSLTSPVPSTAPAGGPSPPAVEASGYDSNSLGIADQVPGSAILTTTPPLQPFPTLITSAPEAEPTAEPLGESSTGVPPAESTVSDADLESTTDSTALPFEGGNSLAEAPAVPAEPLPDNGCPAPEVCDVNCGVYIDPNGCQTCQCLWLGIPCESSDDCVEAGQFCDLGRCECKPGFIQDMLQSGICKRDDAVPESELQKIEAAVDNSRATTRAYPQRFRQKRSQTQQKPNRGDRLQWPGPCDRDSQCPASLYCIQSDCWSIPEKLKVHGVDASLDEDPRSFHIGHDEQVPDQLVEASTTTPLPESPEFDFDSFPQPPPSTPTSTTAREPLEEDEPQPPSLRPLDDDEDSFLGDFRDLLTPRTAPPSTVQTAPPPTATSTAQVPTRRFRTDLEDAVSPVWTPKRRQEGPPRKPGLSELLAGHHFEAPPRAKRPEFGEEPVHGRRHESGLVNMAPTSSWSGSGPESSLPRPKNRDPQVDARGWQPMSAHHHHEHPVHVSSPAVAEPLSREQQRQKPIRDMMSKVILDYSRANRMHRPVRVVMNNAKNVIRDECSRDRQCGERYVCCEKEYCDLSLECGVARFCLPDCETTKMTYLSSTGISGMPLIDLVYD